MDNKRTRVEAYIEVVDLAMDNRVSLVHIYTVVPQSDPSPLMAVERQIDVYRQHCDYLVRVVTIFTNDRIYSTTA